MSLFIEQYAVTSAAQHKISKYKTRLPKNTENSVEIKLLNNTLR